MVFSMAFIEQLYNFEIHYTIIQCGFERNVGCHYFRQACSYLSSRKASSPLGRYQVMLLGDRGI